MKSLSFYLPILTATLLFSACEKSVTGQIFVVTSGRENVKMGLVGVRVLQDKEFKTVAAKVVATIQKEMAQERANSDAREALIKQLLSLEDPELFVPDLQTLREEAASPIAESIVSQLFNPTKALDHATEILVAQLPPPIVTTDADGRFTIPVKSKVWLIAQGERYVGEKSEHYLWIVPCETPKGNQPTPLLISNDSDVDTLEELYALLATQLGIPTNLAQLPEAEVDQETAKWIEATKERARSTIAEVRANLKPLADKRKEIARSELRPPSMHDSRIQELLTNGGKVFAWGSNTHDQCDVPAGLRDVVAIAAIRDRNLALTKEGFVVAWGESYDGECNVPAGLRDVVAISTGFSYNLALKLDGTVVAWGRNDDGECNVPAGLRDVVALSAGSHHSIALKKDGTVVAWGSNSNGECDVPAGLRDVVEISTAFRFSLALKNDGTVVAWGSDSQRNFVAGLRDVVEISTSDSHRLALKKDGTVVAWGFNRDRQCDVPAGLRDVVAISAGDYHSIALKKDGTVVAWGRNDRGQCDVPAGLRDVVAISTEDEQCLAIKNDGTFKIWGDNLYYDVPAGMRNVVAISFGDDHVLAISLEKKIQK